MNSIFMNKESEPTRQELKKALGKTFESWLDLSDFTKLAYPAAVSEWNYSGAKYGWSYRISDKKRVLVYLLPRDGFFKVGLVFGQKATDALLAGSVADEIKNEVLQAKVYGEGRGIRLDVQDETQIADIKELIRVKITH